MKLLLKEIVCENQSTFVVERLITDNVLVAHDVMAHIGKQRKAKSGELALKLDISIEARHEQSL